MRARDGKKMHPVARGHRGVLSASRAVRNVHGIPCRERQERFRSMMKRARLRTLKMGDTKHAIKTIASNHEMSWYQSLVERV